MSRTQLGPTTRSSSGLSWRFSRQRRSRKLIAATWRGQSKIRNHQQIGGSLLLPRCWPWLELALCTVTPASTAPPTKKPTAVLTNLGALDTLARSCCGGHVHQPLSGQTRVRRQDGSSHWVCRAYLAGAYAPQLCSAWAGAVAQWAGPQCFGPEPSWLADWEAELRTLPALRRFRRRSHAEGTDAVTGEAGDFDPRPAEEAIAADNLVFPRHTGNAA